MVRYLTTSGAYVTAATKEAAAALAAEYGMGEIVKPVPLPRKPAKSMTLAKARQIAVDAYEWPRCGEGWPAGPREEEADRILREAGIEPELAAWM